MLQGVQAPPQTLDLGSHILVRKDEVPGHPGPPLCRGRRGLVQDPEPVPSSRGHGPPSGAAPQPRQGPGAGAPPQVRGGPSTAQLCPQSRSRPAQPNAGSAPSALTDVQGAGVRPLGERQAFAELVQHLLLGLGDGVAVQHLHRHALGLSRSRPRRQQRVQGLHRTRGASGPGHTGTARCRATARTARESLGGCLHVAQHLAPCPIPSVW